MRYHKRALLYSVSVPVAYKLAATFLSTVSFPALPTVVLSGRRRTCRKDACTFDILDRLVCHRDGGTGNLVGEAALVVMSFGRHSVGREGWVEIYIHPIIINARLFTICIAKGSSHGSIHVLYSTTFLCARTSPSPLGATGKGDQASKRTYRRHLTFNNEEHGKKMI